MGIFIVSVEFSRDIILPAEKHTLVNPLLSSESGFSASAAALEAAVPLKGSLTSSPLTL